MASAIALIQRHRQVETELAAARALLEERRLIERAEAILMQGRKMTAPEGLSPASNSRRGHCPEPGFADVFLVRASVNKTGCRKVSFLLDTGEFALTGLPPEIRQNRDASMRLLGWLLLVVVLALFIALYFFGMPSGPRDAHPSASEPALNYLVRG